MAMIIMWRCGPCTRPVIPKPCATKPSGSAANSQRHDGMSPEAYSSRVSLAVPSWILCVPRRQCLGELKKETAAKEGCWDHSKYKNHWARPKTEWSSKPIRSCNIEEIAGAGGWKIEKHDNWGKNPEVGTMMKRAMQDLTEESDLPSHQRKRLFCTR